MTISWPRIENVASGLTVTCRYRSPALPPLMPGLPLPASLIFCPSLTPAGTWALNFLPSTDRDTVAPLTAWRRVRLILELRSSPFSGRRGLLIAIAAGIAVRRLAVAAIRLAALACSTTEHREDVVDVVGAAARSGEADARAIAAGTLAEHGTKDVGETGSIEAAGTAGEAGTAHAELTNRVVLLAIFLLAQHVIGFGDVLELLLGFLGLVDVRMVFAGELGGTPS